jgi:sigma-B regulation protein RsbU (phosphoserine phosphatase)
MSSDLPDFQQSFDLKQIEFQAVLDLTIAINKNSPQKGLFIILEDYLLEKLGIDHFSQYMVEEEEWSNSFGYGKVVSGWRGITSMDNQVQVSRFSESIPDLYRLNTHIDFAIPFHFDGILKGIVLCSAPSRFSGPIEAEAIALLQTLLSLMAMALENQRLLAYRIRQEALRKEVEIARQVQRMLFPKNLPDSDALRIYTTYLPHMDVSGDYYDYIRLSEHQFAICVADVSGKGMSAALLMSNFQACLRTLMMEKKELGEAVRTINTLLCQNSNQERFITAFIAVFDTKDKSMTYVNSGHNPPCLVFKQGRVEQLPLGSTILGIFPELPHLVIGKVMISDEVLFVAYTDGLTEMENPDGKEFGVENVEAYMVENRDEKLPVLHQRLLNRLDNFAGQKGFNDDITLLTARIQPNLFPG